MSSWFGRGNALAENNFLEMEEKKGVGYATNGPFEKLPKDRRDRSDKVWM